ncbi:hypothetical protein V5799_023127 [Amblyomma americanum]|uniref:WW domain-containing protein n=1 Tax=Amblyomma americanum TaxID=6943 RepID=A0AAQ4FKG9_AMBAM
MLLVMAELSTSIEFVACGQARYFYVQEKTGHSQWTPPTTASASGSPDSTAQTSAGEQSHNELADIASQLAAPPPPPPQTGNESDAAEETTAIQGDEARRSAEEAENLDGMSLDAAEAAFYSSVALSAEPESSTPQEGSGDKKPSSGDTVPEDEVSVPAVPAPKKKKTKVSGRRLKKNRSGACPADQRSTDWCERWQLSQKTSNFRLHEFLLNYDYSLYKNIIKYMKHYSCRVQH